MWRSVGTARITPPVHAGNHSLVNGVQRFTRGHSPHLGEGVMGMKITSGRGRAAAAVIASMALLGTGAALTAVPAQSAEPAGDCAAPYPADELVDGAAVTGLTVVEGTAPIGFTGTYLGTITGGIAPGLDMLMFEMDFADPKYDEVGIWQGMSGSPVYAEDGRLIGAVAYGLAWGPSMVAGVTPYEDMDDFMGATAPARVRIGDRAARAIAAETDVSREQASEGFRQLPMPTAYSGISPARLRQMKKHGPDYLHTRGATTAGAADSTADVGPEALVAGGNLGAAISYGDVTAGGVGTVTSVCNGDLIGFGHPMNFDGQTTLGLMPADAVYVQGDPVGPGFKVANMGLAAGIIDQDRLTGISGRIGAAEVPDPTDVTSTLQYGSRSRTGESHSMVELYNADVTFSHLLANHDVVLSAIQGGSEEASYRLTGTDADGQPFDITFSDRYTSDFDIAFEGIWDVSDAVWALSQMRGVTLDDVATTATVTDETRTWRIRSLQQRRGGEWTTIGRRQPAIARAGQVLKLRVALADGERSRTVRLSVRVPRRAERHGFLEVQGGASLWNSSFFRAKTPADLEAAAASLVRNDQVHAALNFFQRRRNVVVDSVSRPQDLVVRGGKWAEVRVRR